MIELNKYSADFKNVAWLILAMDLKDAMPMKRHIFVADGVATTTDGHRLHRCNVTIEDGVYRVVKSNKTEVILAPGEADAPDWSRVIPAAKGEPIEVGMWTRPEYAYAEVMRAMPSPTVLDWKYFTDALPNVCNCYVDKKPGAPVLFTDGVDVLAVIMPMNPL